MESIRIILRTIPGLRIIITTTDSHQHNP